MSSYSKNNCSGQTKVARKRCSYCGRQRKKNSELKLFSFPKDKEMCLKWVKACNRPYLEQKSTDKLHSGYKLCSLHFDDKDYASIKRHKLNASACPKFPSESSKNVVSCYTIDLRCLLKDKFSHREREIENEPQFLPSSTHIRINEEMPSAENSHQQKEIENEPQPLPSSIHIIRLKEEMPSAENSDQQKVIIEDSFSEEHLSSDRDIKPLISEIPVVSPAKKRRKTAVSSVTCEIPVVSPARKRRKTVVSSVTREDSYDIFGKYIANEVRSISDKEQQQLLKLKIQAMIYYAHKGWLKTSEDD